MRDSNEWIAKIYEDGPTGLFKVYILTQGPGNINHYVSDIKEGKLQSIPEGAAIEHSMTITRGMMQALFTAIQGQGVKPIEQSFVEGKLSATEKHLEDMRSLVFEKPEIINQEKKI